MESCPRPNAGAVVGAQGVDAAATAPTAPMTSTAPKEADSSPAGLGMRRSCNECGRKRRKCDGGKPSCRRCLRAGDRCTYSKRKWHRPPRSAGDGDDAVESGTDVVVSSASGQLLAYGTLKLKRCKLSPSPATGLVGMQENAFLCDFFSSIGFLPLTTPRDIRSTLVRMMASNTNLEPPDALGDRGGGDQLDTAASEECLSPYFAGKRGPEDLSTCSFWCAVALGALVKGCPVESVAKYHELAMDVLDSYSGPGNVEVAQAWAILGFLYSFMGDAAKFQECMDRSSSFLTASSNQEAPDALPVGFAEIVNQRDADRLCTGDLTLADIKSFCEKHRNPPQVEDVADDRSLYRYVAESAMVLGQTVIGKLFEANVAALRAGSEHYQCWEEEEETTPANFFRAGLGHRTQAEVASAMMAGIQSNFMVFDFVEDMAERLTIDEGIGGLMINGLLAYRKAFQGNIDGALDRITRCINIYERYPGLCRCTSIWAHLVLTLPAALAVMGGERARELYGRLRAVYNPCRPAGEVPLPPFEEWKGVPKDYTDIRVRTIPEVVGNHASRDFPRPRGWGQPNARGTMGSDGDIQGGVASLRVALGRRIQSAIDPVAPCDRVEVQNSTNPFGLTAESAGSLDPIARRTSPKRHPHYRCESDVMPDVDAVRGSESGRSAVHDQGGDTGLSVPDMALVLPDLSEADEPIVDLGEEGIAAADWLEVTNAMLNAAEDMDPRSV